MSTNNTEGENLELGESDRKYLSAILGKDLSRHKANCFALRLSAGLMFLFHLLALSALYFWGDQYFVAAYGISAETVLWWFAAAMSLLSCFIFYHSASANHQNARILHHLNRTTAHKSREQQEGQGQAGFPESEIAT